MESADMSAPRGRSRSRSQPGTSTSRTSSADGYNMADLEGRLAAQRGRTLSPHARQVPDFHKLHETWHRRLATAKATNKRRVTVPQVCVWERGRRGGSGARLQPAYVTLQLSFGRRLLSIAVHGRYMHAATQRCQCRSQQWSNQRQGPPTVPCIVVAVGL